MKKIFFAGLSLFLFLGVILSAGAGETEKTVTLTITGSSTTHTARTYDVELKNPTNGTLGTPKKITLTINSGAGAQGVLSIRMIDPIVDRDGTTGATQRFAIDRTVNTGGTASVTYTVAGSGTSPAVASDFVGATLPTGTVGFAAGETSKTVSLGIAGKAAPSASVSYTITLSTPIGANLGTATATAQIQNAGEGPQVTWSISSPTLVVDRGEAGVVQSIDISRSSGTGAATINYTTAPGGSNPATSEDFVPTGFPSGVASFANLETIKRLSWNLAGLPGTGPTVTYDAAINSPSTGSIGNGAVRLTVQDTGETEDVTLPFRVNSGGTTLFTDGTNQQWASDVHYVGGTVKTTASAIAGTTDDALFHRQRVGGPVKYILSGLPSSQTYDVTLFLAEIDSAESGNCSVGNAGARRMDFYNNSTLVVEDIDTCKAVGYLTAHSQNFTDLSANAEGQMVLELRSNANATVLPSLAAMFVRVHEETPTAEKLLIFGRPGQTSEDDLGRTWVNGDQYVLGCNSTFDGENPIRGTNNPGLYWGRCNGRTLNLSIPIDPDGETDRTIFLGFSEHVAAAEGQRLMDISVEGVTAATGFDILDAAGGLDQAYRLRWDTTISGNTIDITLAGTAALTAQINNISILKPTETPPVEYVAKIGWKSSFVLPKNTIVQAFAPPRGIAESGNPLVVRAVDDTGSTLFVEHGTVCSTSPTHGAKSDTTDTNNTLYLCVQTWNPANHSASLFSLAENGSEVDTFAVEVCEVNRRTGETLNCQPFTVGVKVSRAGL